MTMGLSASLNTAQQALATNAALSSIVSRNIAGVNDPNYTRKSGELITNASGSATLVKVNQAADKALFTALLSANADAASSSALQNGLDQIEQTVSLTNIATSSAESSTTDTSPATLIATLASKLQSYAASPNDDASGAAVVSAAQSLATNLNQATTTVQGIRAQADASIATSVQSINDLLGQFKTLNDAVVKGTATRADVTDTIDQRNTVLQSLSKEIGITTVGQPNGGLSIYTDSGVTLFQGVPRTVSFTATATYTAGTTGNAIVVDGVPVTGASATMPIQSGAIAGLAQLRDNTTVSYQNQLDQIAQGLVSAFGESDQTGGSAATIPGLFTAAGASATATTAPVGLAGSITVNANVDPSQGGTLSRLRDGGVGDPTNAAYDGNPSGAASYSTHLNALLQNLDGTRSFDASSGGTSSGNLSSYASSSISWLEATRSAVTSTSTDRSATATAAATSLSSTTGVNLDQELSKMLDLEHSYSASAELLSTVKTMFDSLLTAIR